MYKSRYVTAIIVAGGKGTRMKSNVNKQFIKIDNKEILAITIEKFQSINEIDEIILVTAQEYLFFCKKNIVQHYNYNKVKKIISGGDTRQQSVFNGLKAVDNFGITLIHDGARPFVSKEIIINNIRALDHDKAACTGVKAKDTVKLATDNDYIKQTLERNRLWIVQTPQTFETEVVFRAHQTAYSKNFIGTDDSILVERIGCKVKMIEGSYSNIKITTPEDIFFAEKINKTQIKLN